MVLTQLLLQTNSTYPHLHSSVHVHVHCSLISMCIVCTLACALYRFTRSVSIIHFFHSPLFHCFTLSFLYLFPATSLSLSLHLALPLSLSPSPSSSLLPHSISLPLPLSYPSSSFSTFPLSLSFPLSPSLPPLSLLLPPSLSFPSPFSSHSKIEVAAATLTYDMENLSKHQFEITSDRRVVSLQASSQEAMLYWLTTLQQKRRKFSTKRKKTLIDNAPEKVSAVESVRVKVVPKVAG